MVALLLNRWICYGNIITGHDLWSFTVATTLKRNTISADQQTRHVAVYSRTRIIRENINVTFSPHTHTHQLDKSILTRRARSETVYAGMVYRHCCDRLEIIPLLSGRLSYYRYATDCSIAAKFTVHSAMHEILTVDCQKNH